LPRKITIRGLPVFSGAVLSENHSIWDELRTVEDYARFARKLRGQFAIVVDQGAEIFAITDFGCSRPVFYQWDRERSCYRLAIRLKDLVPSSLSQAALFFYTTRRGIGIEPFYRDVKELFPATVSRFHGDRVDSTTYLDWGEFLEPQPISPEAAEERFVEIASEYLGAIFAGAGKVGCLLSGGTDSALVAWILKSLGKEVVCLTADYNWSRYSEFSEAARHTSALGLRHKRVKIVMRNHLVAFHALNGEFQNAPCCHSQSPSLLELGKSALREGLQAVVTGDHADALFLGFDRYFRGFPQASAEYSAAISKLSAAQKLDRLYSKPGLNPAQEELLSAMGCSRKECMEWQEGLYLQDRQKMGTWADAVSFPTLQQLDGQIWAGIGWQNIFLPASAALEERMEFVSPFYDIEMIRFALSLPLEYKFHNRVTKVLLRAVLQRVLKRDLPKRASPNPSRVWSLLPRLKDRARMGPSLRPLYDGAYRRNLMNLGRSSAELDHIAALGMWLSSQKG
jgi:asparagine synthase (glutamine-hydrolysing)